MDIGTILLALVVTGLLFWLIKKVPAGAASVLQKIGVVLFMIVYIAGYLVVFALIGLFALLAVLMFLVGSALRFAGEHATMVSLPLLATVKEHGKTIVDAVLRRT